jgi:hypothetical protein
MRRKRSSVVLALALAVTGCGSSRHTVTQEAGAAKARTGIALDHRIGPVSFAEPEPRITKALGKGVVASLDGHRLRYYPTAGIYIDYPPNHPPGGPTAAVIIVTRSTRYRTPSGVGVGSSLRQLRRRVKVRCYPVSTSTPDTCQHERSNQNLPFTVFNIDPTTKRVSQVAVVLGGD